MIMRKSVFVFLCCLVLSIPGHLLAETGKTASGLALSVNFISYGRSSGLRTIKEGSTLLSGEKYAIYFVPEQDCYVYIYQIDSAGCTIRLFPMERFGHIVLNNRNPVKKGGVYYIPSETKWFKLDNTVGEERIYLIASKKRLDEFEKSSESSGAAGTTKKIRNVKDRLNFYFKSKGGATKERTGQRRSVSGPKGESEKASFDVFDRRITTLGDCFVKTLKFMHK